MHHPLNNKYSRSLYKTYHNRGGYIKTPFVAFHAVRSGNENVMNFALVNKFRCSLKPRFLFEKLKKLK